MKQTIFFILILILNQSNELDMDKYSENVQLLSNNSIIVKDFDDFMKYLLSIDPNYGKEKKLKDFDFNCEPISYEPAKSVHELKPNDIKVIASMGDSITAAFGAKSDSLKNIKTEYRGISWSIGGDENIDAYATLPNMLKLFNPKIDGYSIGEYSLKETKNGVGLNVAVSGAESKDIPDQAKILIKRLMASKNFDWKNDWKLITLFIGANDLCAHCKNLDEYSPLAYIKSIEEGIDLLYEKLPKTFVNLVTVLDLSQLILEDKTLTCARLHNFLCPCIASPSIEQEKILNNFNKQYQLLTEGLANSGKYDTKDDFTVVFQPLFKNFKMPKLPNGEMDLSYFAPDCFHPSAKTHGENYI